MRRIPRFPLALAAIYANSLHAGLFDRNATRVIVDAYATEEYRARKAAPDAPEFETYHFLKGEFHSGNIRDKSLPSVPFRDVVETLAKELRKQNYFPEENPRRGDLLIVINWGSTEIDNFDELLGDFLAEAEAAEAEQTDSVDELALEEEQVESLNETDPSAPDRPLEQGEYDMMNNDRVNAAILGFNRTLDHKTMMPSEEIELREALKEERYFIVLKAYDYAHFLKTKEMKFLWSTRFSLPSTGTNFEDAYFALARGAAPYYGTHLDDLARTKTHLGKGTATVGELEVISIEEESASDE